MPTLVLIFSPRQYKQMNLLAFSSWDTSNGQALILSTQKLSIATDLFQCLSRSYIPSLLALLSGFAMSTIKSAYLALCSFQANETNASWDVLLVSRLHNLCVFSRWSEPWSKYFICDSAPSDLLYMSTLSRTPPYFGQIEQSHCCFFLCLCLCFVLAQLPSEILKNHTGCDHDM